MPIHWEKTKCGIEYVRGLPRHWQISLTPLQNGMAEVSELHLIQPHPFTPVREEVWEMDVARQVAEEWAQRIIDNFGGQS